MFLGGRFPGQKSGNNGVFPVISWKGSEFAERHCKRGDGSQEASRQFQQPHGDGPRVMLQVGNSYSYTLKYTSYWNPQKCWFGDQFFLLYQGPFSSSIFWFSVKES